MRQGELHLLLWMSDTDADLLGAGDLSVSVGLEGEADEDQPDWLSVEVL